MQGCRRQHTGVGAIDIHLLLIRQNAAPALGNHLQGTRLSPHPPDAFQSGDALGV